MIEHLQEHAVQRGGFFGCQGGFAAGPFGHGKNAQQAITQVIDGRVRQHALQIPLRKRRARRKNDRDNCQPQQRRENPSHLLRKNRQQNAQEAINPHLGHHSRQEHRRARRSFGVSRRQPRVERNQRHFHSKAQKRARENDQGQGSLTLLTLERLVPAQFHRQRLSQRPVSPQISQLGKIEFPRGQKDRQKGQQQRHAARHGINEKLCRGGRPERSAPKFDQEERRDQA